MQGENRCFRRAMVGGVPHAHGTGDRKYLEYDERYSRARCARDRRDYRA